MAKKEILHFCRNVAIAKVWRDEQLCYAFSGASEHSISDVFSKMKSLYEHCEISTIEQPRIVSGHYYRSVFVTITGPVFSLLPEDKWTMMIEHFLKKIMPCEVTFIEDFDEFINS